jgi:epoxyqueuosine reductase
MHHYRQINYFLDRAALLTACFIQERGYRALSIAASQIIDWERQRAHVPHKKIGQLAGLGWLGRSNLLVNPGCGAQFRLVTVLTDMPLKADAPLADDCGECERCRSSCPAAAIGETREAFDHQACFEKLKEFRRSGLVSQYICGVCVKACRGGARR